MGEIPRLAKEMSLSWNFTMGENLNFLQWIDETNKVNSVCRRRKVNHDHNL